MFKEDGGKNGALRLLGALHVDCKERVCIVQLSRMLFNQCDAWRKLAALG